MQLDLQKQAGFGLWDAVCLGFVSMTSKMPSKFTILLVHEMVVLKNVIYLIFLKYTFVVAGELGKLKSN